MRRTIFSCKKFITPGKISIGIFLLSFLFYSIITFKLFPTNVAFKYQILAQHYLNNELEQERLLDLSPLYFYVHIIARKISTNPNALILWIQIVLSACSSVFLFHLIHSFFSHLIAFLGVFVFITNRSVILYTGAFEPEPFMIFFILGFLVFSTSPRRNNSFLSGIFLSLSLLTRSNFFPLIVLVPIFLRLNYKPHKKFVRSMILFELPVLIVLSFLLIRNTSITGSFTPFSMNPGYVFFEGNNPNSTGESAIYPPLVNDVKQDFEQQPDVQHIIYRVFARRIKGEDLSIPGINAYWTNKAKNFIVDYPEHFLKLLLTKVNFFFHNFRRHDLSNIYWNDYILQKRLPTIPYAFISAMALLGMIFSMKTWKKRLLIYTVFLAQFGIMLLTYVSDRQRVVIVAVMIFFAAETLHRAIQSKTYRFMILGSILVLFPFFYMHNDLMKEDTYTWNRYSLANQILQEARQGREDGNWQLASAKNAHALALVPANIENTRLTKLSFPAKKFREYALDIALSFQEQDFSALFDLAILYIQTGRLAKAQFLLKRLVDGNYAFNRQYIQSSQPYFYLARISELHNESQEAVTFLEKALHNNPGDPWVLSHIFALTNIPLYKTRISRYFDEIDAEFFLGQAFLDTGRYEEAVKSFCYVVEKLPEYRKGKIYLSIALGAVGKYEQAVKHYLSAIRMRREPIFREQDVLSIFRTVAEKYPKDTETTYYFGIILQDFGHHEEALNVQKQLLERHFAELDGRNQKRIENAIRRLESILQAY